MLGQNARSPSSIRVPNLCVVNDAPATCSRVDQTTRADWAQRPYLTGHLSLDYVARQVTFHQNQRQEQHQPSEVCSSKGWPDLAVERMSFEDSTATTMCSTCDLSALGVPLHEKPVMFTCYH